MKFECTNCGQHLEADKSQQGQQFECPSCSATVEVPTTEPIDAQSAPPPLPKSPATNEAPSVEPDKEDKEKMAGLRGALLVMPLYMLYLLFLLFTLWQSTGLKANPAMAKLGWFALIILFGVSARSWQCLRWIQTDPYKAVAFGKKLYLIFIVLSCLDTLISEWPSDKFEGPLSALSTEQVSHGYYDQRKLHVVDPNETMVIKAGYWEWLSFLFSLASQLMEKLAVFAFISVLYTRLRGRRPEFTWDHFLNEISFGKWGAKYNWS
jgi:hypothetical protein